MATATRKLKFAWGTFGTDIVDNTLTSIGSITVDIPENSVTHPVTFKAVYLEVFFADIVTATGGTIASTQAQLTITGQSASNVTDANALTNSGECIAGIFGPIDFTAYFVASYGTSATKSIDCSVLFDQNTGTTLGMRHVSAILYVNYEYDTAEATYSNTLTLPLETATGSLATTTNNAFATIPALTGSNTYLVENTPVITDYFIVLEGNTYNNNNATDHNMTYAIDSGSSTALTTVEAALATDSWFRFIIRLTGSNPSTGSSHTFNLWNSLATRWSGLTAKLVVTYKYTASGTTRALNSLEFPFILSNLLGTTSAALLNQRVTAVIIEPNVSLKQSAVELLGVSTTNPSVAIKVGSQAGFTTYSGSQVQVAGPSQYSMRIDGGTPGNGLSFARGEVNIDVNAYRTNANSFSMVTGVIYLNYISDVHASGLHVHNHNYDPVLIRQMSYSAVNDATSSITPAIPETSYFVNSAYVVTRFWITSDGSIFRYLIERVSGEGLAAGCESVSCEYAPDIELSPGVIYFPFTDRFKRYPTDPTFGKLDLETNRNYRPHVSPIAAALGSVLRTVYHSATYTLSGTITNSNGGTVTIKIFRADTYQLVESTSRSGNGAWSVTVYDDVINYYAVAYEAATYKGRSKNNVGGSTDLDISLTGGGGETCYVG